MAQPYEEEPLASNYDLGMWSESCNEDNCLLQEETEVTDDTPSMTEMER